ncbi:MAG: hypothetical protein R3F30_00565 [Planctomycetota bacterium]
MTDWLPDRPPRGLAPLLGVVAAGLAVWLLARVAGSTTEDAWIVFRFARNLGEGHGLVPFPGEPPQDGFTSLAKTAWLGLGHALGVPIQGLATWTGIACFLGAALCAGRWLAALVPAAWGATATAVGTIAALGGYELAFWCSGGLVPAEVALVLVATGLLVHRAVLAPAPRVLMGLAGLSVMAWALRPEGVLLAPLVAVLCAAGWFGGRRPVPLRAAGLAAATALAGLGALALFRVLYLGDLLSNPGHVKLAVRQWLDPCRDLDGWLALRGPAFTAVLGLSLLVALGASLVAVARRRLGPLTLTLGVVTGLLAYRWFYDWYVHGDYMEWFRFLAPNQPLVAVLLAAAGLQLAHWLADVVQPPEPGGDGADARRSPAVVAGCAVVALLPTAVGVASGLDPRAPPEWTVSGHGLAADHPLVEAAARLRQVLRYGLNEQDVYATSEFGYVPYHVPNRGIDLMGLNDRRIALTHALYPDVFAAVAAARDSVLARTPVVIATYGYWRAPGGDLVVDPGIGWWFGCYFDSAFFEASYDWERELPEAPGRRLTFSYLRRPVPELRRVGVDLPANDVRLLHGVRREGDALVVAPIARVLLDRLASGPTLVHTPGALHMDSSQLPALVLRGRGGEVPLTLEVRTDGRTVGDRLVRSIAVPAGGAFEARFDQDEVPYLEPGRLLLSLWARSDLGAPAWTMRSCGFE